MKIFAVVTVNVYLQEYILLFLRNKFRDFAHNTEAFEVWLNKIQGVRVIVFNATFINISVISWR